jgi:cholesterol transport system auxiliary component
MTAHPPRFQCWLIAILSLAPLLAGCGGLIPEAPTRQLYRLTPTLAIPPGLPHVSVQLLVATPTAPAGLDTPRIALSRTPVSLDYFADAVWSDRVPFLVQDALVQGFQKSAAIPAVAPDRGGLRADFVIDTAVGDFSAAYDSPNGAPRSSITLDATLVRMPDRSIVGRRSVRREVSAATNTVPDIVRAFDAAMGGAVDELVTWTLRNPALSERRRSVISRTRFVHAGRGEGP